MEFPPGFGLRRFKTESIPLIFSKIAEMGFDAVEIAAENPALIDANAVKKGLQEYGLQANCLWRFWPFTRSYKG